MADAGNWTTIESDPGCFTELCALMGAQAVQVEELVSMDLDSLRRIEPVYGFIFLFQYQKGQTAWDSKRPVCTELPPDLFFASQVISNACATQAILSILLNRPEIELGQELAGLKEFTRDFPPELKGMAISNSDKIRAAHNSFARPDPIVEESRMATEKDEVFHFVSYVPVDGVLYELDGLKAGPIKLGDVPEGGDWLELVTPAIFERIERSAQGNEKFSLMAIIKDRRVVLRERIAELETTKNEKLAQLQAQMAAATSDERRQEIENEAMVSVSGVEIEIGERIAEVEQEEQKFVQWREENVRRRWDYFPFIYHTLRVLAEKNMLPNSV
eukprot:CAMPEP_0170143268 /NCGR_PEP_ID=MMETSP0033_2-20121228/9855_1 /TAXON_ID=195969 /ORGANISM="Dolichomastix tenuilepis, Strain CCMP3274" /LENGTH=329 /DNA_ID=CAMNT_0010379703 /DNA_START=70 /DNA_END=1059 /DNA_ORIENTATION=+